MPAIINRFSEIEFDYEFTDIENEFEILMDKNGFILSASRNFKFFQKQIADSFFPLHVSDLTTREYGAFLKSHVCAAASEESYVVSAEFPADHCWEEAAECDGGCEPWYSLSVSPIGSATGATEGVAGRIRLVQHRHRLDRELRAPAHICPTIRLADSRVFAARLQRCLNIGGSHCLTVLAVDALQALKFRFGRHACDELLWGFSTFVKTMALPEFELGHLCNDQIGVLMPNTSQSAAYKWSSEVIRTFSLLAKDHLSSFAKMSASAGISPVRFSGEWSIQEAEIALIMSRSGGGSRASFTWPRDTAYDPPVGVLCGDPVNGVPTKSRQIA